ncbi:Ribosomal RNA small subunit methyltransferase I RsmL [Helicobacter sp. NHP19-003]|uniref:Ribosomal RNA small subunit methyltransferase I n=1 Tax=Helicobacter gastrocanis TaxID=2849641 RepID=A0ABM7SAY4_9HELI|nr:16S rRNA (cytidine(1402)-2'-O)-methyltransferase [Helicobacter sp. NHP19-003]BCZ16872.1 Ribosomal RNA small subunit methyltransferase I RsmL [Helicobacter sp. NHP19-003]
MLTLSATPIGNLRDITWRALEALAGCAVCLCEDVRVGKRLLFLLKQQEWATPLRSAQEKRFLPFHSHNQEAFLRQTPPNFFTDQEVVFISDAGMPCVSDPGAKLVAFAQEHNLPYEILPGASACVGAYSASGFESAGFNFVGFLPPKARDRCALLANLKGQAGVFVFYESPQRLLDTLADLSALFSHSHLFAIKEVSKLHEQRFKGPVLEVATQLRALQHSKALHGEWVLVLQNQEEAEPSLSYTQIAQMSLPPKIKAKLLAQLTNTAPKALYTQTLEG